MKKATQIALQDKKKGKVHQEIILQTEPEEHVAGFILGNARCRTCNGIRLREGIYEEAVAWLMAVLAPIEICECEPSGQVPVVERESKKGTKLVICGAGPSLREAGDYLSAHDGDIWGANSALNWLVENGYNATHGVAVDASQRMFLDTEKPDGGTLGGVWKNPPDVEYLIATSTNVGLTDHLLAHGRSVTHFHSIRGSEFEGWLYGLIYPLTCIAIYGLNVVNRAIDLAEYMGYDHIALVGVDSALANDRTMYADGRGTYDDDVILEGDIDGRHWVTKPDMLMSACELVRARGRLGSERLEFVGDTLPKALEDKDDAFLKRCIDWVANES